MSASRCPFASRRGLLAAAGGFAGLLGMGAAARAAGPAPDAAPPAPPAPAPDGIEPFHGPHQGGILTPQQGHTYFATFDLTVTSASEVAALLRTWTDAAARMSVGQTAAELGDDPDAPPADSGDAIGLKPARLTLTFGFGPTLFVKDGKDRFGLASQRPEALVDLPLFNGDQLQEARTGGDLSVQACADDPQVAFHAIRQLARLAYGAAQMRWAQTGFSAAFAAGETGRNLMGFKDGTANPVAAGPSGSPAGTARPMLEAEKVVWVGEEGPAWMRGGSYVVARRIRISLEHWDRTDVGFQEQVVGRRKMSGAPLGAQAEFDAVDLDATDKDGNLVIPEDAHVRLSSPAANGGATILRRGYSYNDGLSFTAERWPPWRQGMMYDAGLLFVGYQRDPRTGFIRVYDTMSKLDAMNQFATHVGSGLFACPGGVRPGEFIGQGLFEKV